MDVATHAAAGCRENAACAAQEHPFPRAVVPVLRCNGDAVSPELLPAICEHELQIRVNGKTLVSLLCSRAAIRELAYGFLYDEGVIGSLGDVRSCVVDEEAMTASFELRRPVPAFGHPVSSSGLGGKVLCSPLAPAPFDRRGACDADEMCERATAVGALPASFPDLASGAGCSPRLASASDFSGVSAVPEVLRAMRSMSDAAHEHAATRGMHCSALFRNGAMLGCFEDIGRHNTFDKLAGDCLLRSMPPQGTLLTTTGRVSGEMMRKALQLGVSGVASYSGPTDVAVGLARAAGVLLVGYAGKGDSAIVYTVPTDAARREGCGCVAFARTAM